MTNNNKYRKKWPLFVLSFLVISCFFLLIDESPNQAYLDLTTPKEVSSEAWKNFQKIASANINSDEPLVTYQMFIDSLNLHEETEALEILIENGPLLAISESLDQYCTLEKDVSRYFYSCLGEYIANKEEIRKIAAKNMRLLSRLKQADYLSSIKVDYNIFNSSNSETKLLDEGIIFLGDHYPGNTRHLLNVISLDNALENLDTKTCPNKLVSELRSSVRLVKQSNHLMFYVYELVNLDRRLDVINYLINHYPSISHCFVNFSYDNSDLIEGWYSTFDAYQGYRLKSLSHALLKEMQNLPWYQKLFFKHQKTLNEVASQHSYLTNDKQLKHPPIFTGVSSLEKSEINKINHWNNILGYFVLSIVEPRYIDLKEDAAITRLSLRLIQVNAELKHCKIVGNTNCASILSKYPDPYLGKLPTIDKKDNTLNYVYTETSRISISLN